MFFGEYGMVPYLCSKGSFSRHVFAQLRLTIANVNGPVLFLSCTFRFLLWRSIRTRVGHVILSMPGLIASLFSWPCEGMKERKQCMILNKDGVLFASSCQLTDCFGAPTAFKMSRPHFRQAARYQRLTLSIQIQNFRGWRNAGVHSKKGSMDSLQSHD